MKRLYLALAIASFFGLFGCTPENNQEVVATAITLNIHELTLEEGGNEVLTVSFTPENVTNKALTWVSSNKSIAEVTDGIVVGVSVGWTEIVVKNGDLMDKCTVMVIAPDPAKRVIVAVDLGLSVKWGSVNLGASAPEEYGEYYAWGETETKDEYSWSTYKWANGDNNDKVTKYCPTNNTDYWDGEGRPDNKTVLDTEDDVAHVILGGSWRMPTDAEWTELRTECKWTWTTEHGVHGRRVTGPNGNSIFLPAAGCRHYSDLGSAGSDGEYWSSPLDTGDPRCAFLMRFTSSKLGGSSFFRSDGRSVRPVCE